MKPGGSYTKRTTRSATRDVASAATGSTSRRPTTSTPLATSFLSTGTASTEVTDTTICHWCQQPIGDEDPVRTVAGEAVHSDCVLGSELLNDDITPGDVEGVRERLLDDDRLEEASTEYRAGWIDAAIAFDMLLTDPEAFDDGQ